MSKMFTVETKLYLRDPAAPFFSLLLPVILLLALGSIPTLRQVSPELGNLRPVDTYLPGMMSMLAVMTLAFTVLPGTLSTYRESGVLRRMSTTPASPAKLLGVHLILIVLLSVLAITAIVVAGYLVHDVAVPRNPLGFLLVFVLGSASLMAIGLIVAALAPNGKAASGIGSAVMFPLMFVSGMWFPRETMPEWLQRIGDYLPAVPFGQAMRDTWAGSAPAVHDLVVMAVTVVAASLVAARVFRWE